MAHLFKKKDRHVIPNWRSFENTVKLGELNGSKGLELVSNFRPDISDILEDWSEIDNHTIGMAGDILAVAIVSNQESNPQIIDIAKFVLKNEAVSPNALTTVAKEILKPTARMTVDLDFDTIELFQDRTNLITIYRKISELKRKLINNPSHSINWIEIGRLYAIIGQHLKAEKAIKNALFLAPENRFILRTMTRFFVHSGESGVAFAHDIIRKTNIVKHDPWILATEISLATLRGRNSKFIKQGLQIIDSSSFAPFNTTELASSLATVEMKNSNAKKSKKLFQLSLISPNDNSLAQAEWASQENNILFPINSIEMNLANSFEAKARDFAEKEKWIQALEFSKKWFLDLPFSKGSILFANNIAINKLKDHEIAANIGKLGLLAHPHDPVLLNNIIYSLSIQNKIEEAKLLLEKVDRIDLSSKNDNKVCLLATKGLLNYRTGNLEIARKFYKESIDLAIEIDNKQLVTKALVNMAREEILIGTDDISDVVTYLKSFSKKSDDEDLKDDIKSVIELYEKRNQFQATSTFSHIRSLLPS